MPTALRAGAVNGSRLTLMSIKELNEFEFAGAAVTRDHL